ncbi:MAG: thioredoxin family protein [Bacteroidota bacterium]|nr:thioredoxin family protein [Bacteroidota bacterium]MDP4233096.1 thioredoxin family protein [Bacteroidota bacterium]MDP4241759.1 thioredoxin family protein [Bacteroidota bacterium]MDP4287417.1 thioredoxin family protein [Bacteroidota bacterium]
MKYLSIAALLMLVAARPAISEVHFREVGFEAAKKLAATEHKKVMVDFYTGWCGWCKVLDRNTYSDEHVGQIADAKFVSIKIDAEHGEGVALAKQYKVSGYPTIIFFAPDGEVIDRVVGYEDASSFARSLEQASSGGSKAVIDEIESGTPVTDPAKWMIAASKYQQQHNQEKALAAYDRVIQYDPENKLHLKEEAVYQVAFLSPGEQQVLELEKAVTEYPMRSEGTQAIMIIIDHYLRQKDPQLFLKAERMIDMWAVRRPDDAQAFNYFAWAAAERGASLDKAESYAKRAVSLAKDNTERASYMDTQAEVLYQQGHKAEASALEDKALALTDPVKDGRLQKQLRMQKDKFDGKIVDLK